MTSTLVRAWLEGPLNGTNFLHDAALRSHIPVPYEEGIRVLNPTESFHRRQSNGQAAATTRVRGRSEDAWGKRKSDQVQQADEKQRLEYDQSDASGNVSEGCIDQDFIWKANQADSWVLQDMKIGGKVMGPSCWERSSKLEQEQKRPDSSAFTGRYK
jgi:hypothetical protein